MSRFNVKFEVGEGPQANAKNVIERVAEALEKAGASADDVKFFREQCKGADYSQLLHVVSTWVKVG